MFSLGLEFSLRKLLQVGPTAGIVAVIQCSLMIWLGYVAGQAFGWTALESIFAGALIAISSTTIIVKAFDEQGIKGQLAELVFGILIVEDLIAILLLAMLTAVASGAGLSAGGAGARPWAGWPPSWSGLLVRGHAGGAARWCALIVRLGRAETTLVACVGICFALALLAQEFGYSVALGAFLAGLAGRRVGRGARPSSTPSQPVRDMFAAIFFVSVGMLIDPVLVARALGGGAGAHGWWWSSARWSAWRWAPSSPGSGMRTSVQAGMSLAQIGEFSFIIAGARALAGRDAATSSTRSRWRSRRSPRCSPPG